LDNMSEQKTSLVMNNRYRLERRLGTGGMAVVYEGYDLMLERMVAVKILRQDFSKDDMFRQRFHQEAKAAANLTHPNIVTVHDYGLASGYPFIVMEYVPGMDLKTMLKQRGAMSVKKTLRLMIQACAGLGYAHRAGLVHCDIKPHNLLITPDMRLKITDFGIARAMASIHPEEHSAYVWGSPLYFSPEQAAGGAPSPASDVYSLGVVMYEMLVGHPPFQGTSAEELAQQHLVAQPIPPSALNVEIPQALEMILMKVLSKEPSARYRTADQLGHLLLALSKQAEGETAAASQAYSQREEKWEAGNRGSDLDNGRMLEEKESNDLDWATILLGLLALIAVGGLIPFWIWVYYK